MLLFGFYYHIIFSKGMEKEEPAVSLIGQDAAALQKYSIMREKAVQRASRSRFSSKSNITDRNAKEKFTKKLSALSNPQPELQQRYWGTLKPFYFETETKIPRIIISKTLLRSLLINLLIIFVVCIWVPVTTNQSMFKQALSPRGFNRLLTDTDLSEERLGTSYSARYIARKYSLYIYSGIWSCYQLFFLAVLLLGNPGYGQITQKRQISLEEQAEIVKEGEKNLYGLNKCSSCKAVVDNSVYHCPECDLCCEGFSHHCEWIGKCIGYKNQIFLKAYYFGFFIGLFFFILVIIMQSIPISAS